jgi:hypothetical protein
MKESITFNFTFDQLRPSGATNSFSFGVPAKTRQEALRSLMVDLRNIANEIEESLNDFRVSDGELKE